MTYEDPLIKALQSANLANDALEAYYKQLAQLRFLNGSLLREADEVLAERTRILNSTQPALDYLHRRQVNDSRTFILQQLEKINSASSLASAAEVAMANSRLIGIAEQCASLRGFDLISSAQFPESHTLTRLAEEVARTVAPFGAAFRRNQLWAQQIEDQMRAMSTPWVMPELAALSIEGFAVVSRLNTAVRYRVPYAEDASKVIDEDLGDPIIVDDNADSEARDAAHIEAGMHPGILAFAPHAVGEILIRTGFVFKVNYAPLPATIDGSDPGLVSHPGHNALITSVEQHLRARISKEMKKHYGDDWIDTCVAAEVVADWKKRREEGVAKGEAPLDLLQYSNFMDLKDIIIRRSHWRDIFEVIFRNKEHFSVSMERLHPIRHPLSHARPIGTGQQIHLCSEASRILLALGIDIFEK